eukprot:scaffold113349_cov18-Tisochrysis_lutea.AAC.1
MGDACKISARFACCSRAFLSSLRAQPPAAVLTNDPTHTNTTHLATQRRTHRRGWVCLQKKRTLGVQHDGLRPRLIHKQLCVCAFAHRRGTPHLAGRQRQLDFPGNFGGIVNHQSPTLGSADEGPRWGPRAGC